MATPNPNGSNQYTSDPREQICWDFYVAQLANGIDNAYQAAIDAGYGASHAAHITLQRWFGERKSKLRRKEILSKAEEVLKETLEMDTTDANNPKRNDHQLHRIKVDVAKTVATTLGKDLGYSSRNETTGKNGGPIEVTDYELTDRDRELLEMISQYERDADTEVEPAEGNEAEPVGEEVQDQE